MFKNSYLASMPTFKLVLGFGLCTVGGVMLYTYFKRRDDEEEEESKLQQAKSTRKLPNGTQEQAPKKDVTIEITISNKHIPLVAGRCGSNLAFIEERSQTNIHCRDKNEAHQLCSITGSPEAVKQARTLLLREIERSPIVKEKMVLGRVFHMIGDCYNEISRISSADIETESGSLCRGTICITGSQEQVNIARKLIEDKIQEHENELHSVEQHREPRRSPTKSLSSSIYSSQTSPSSSHLPPREKLLMATGNADEKPLEVYVSACASPSKFWVQLIGPQSKRLDELVQTMTDYYSIAENRKLHKIAEPYQIAALESQIVATVFKNDGKWYRAEIVAVLPNQYNSDELVLDLYFVDYGDSEYVRPHEFFELRTDFLTLRFQAVECYLANVKSTLLNESKSWEIQSIQKFEELTQVGNWKRLISRVVTYRERPKSAVGVSGKNAFARKGSPVPGVELYDPAEGAEINVGDLLISQGFALPADDYRPRSPYSAATNNSVHLSSECLSETSPPTSIKSDATTTSVENKLIEQQQEHLQHNNNLYLNGNGGAEDSIINPAKLSAELFNGYATTTATERTTEIPTATLNSSDKIDKKHTNDNLLWNNNSKMDLHGI